jgi:hypothetical protein
MNMKALLMLFILVALGLAVAPDGFAAIYKYVDKDGMVCFADDLQSVPEQYRAAVKILGGEPEAEKKTVMRDQPQAQSEAKPEAAVVSTVQANVSTEAGEKNIFSRKVLTSLVVVGSSLILIILLGMLNTTDHKKTVALFRMAIIGGTFAYLFYAHAGDLFQVAKSLRTEVSTVQQKAEERGKKAAEAIKKMNALKEELKNAGPPDSEEPGSEKQN